LNNPIKAMKEKPPADDGSTEQKILEAARTVFLRRGTAGARMQEIAEEAGVNQALLHYYFRSKDRLAAAVFREVAGRLIPGVVQLLGSDAGIEEKVERFVHLYIDTVRHTPFLPAYVMSELHHHPERLHSVVIEAAGGQASEPQRLLQLLGTQLRQAADAGGIRPIAPEQFLLNLVGLVAAPFLVLPALQPLFGVDAAAFARLLNERRAELPTLILNSLRP
jgi:AcrR family transcriptional regulator